MPDKTNLAGSTLGTRLFVRAVPDGRERSGPRRRP
jgi:hypothetical protein